MAISASNNSANNFDDDFLIFLNVYEMKAYIKTNVTQILYGFRKHTSITLLCFHVTQVFNVNRYHPWPFQNMAELISMILLKNK